MKLKRILAVVLALALALALSACGDNTSASDSGGSPATDDGTGTSGEQTSDPGTEEGKFGTYYIGYNNFAPGIWERAWAQADLPIALQPEPLILDADSVARWDFRGLLERMAQPVRKVPEERRAIRLLMRTSPQSNWRR